MTPPKNVSPFPQKPMMDYMQLNVKNEELKEKMKCLFDTEEGQAALSIDKQDGNLDGTISASNWKNFVNSLFADKKSAEQYYLQEDSISTIDAVDLIKEIKAKKEEVLEDGTLRKYNPDKSYSDNLPDGRVHNYDINNHWVGGIDEKGNSYVRFKKDDGSIVYIYDNGNVIQRDDEDNFIKGTVGRNGGEDEGATGINDDNGDIKMLTTDTGITRTKEPSHRENVGVVSHKNVYLNQVLKYFTPSERQRFIEQQTAYNRNFGL